MLNLKEQINPYESFLIHGLNAVDIEYMRFEYNFLDEGSQYPERVFNAELYHQLRKLQEADNSVELKIHPEITKHLLKLHMEPVKLNYQRHRNIPCIGDYIPIRVSPDIVFHGGQMNRKKQRLVAEIKMEKPEPLKVIRDLQKLLFYKLSNLKFENAVFIFTGKKEDLEELLITWLSESKLDCLIKHQVVVALPSIKGRRKITWKVYKFSR